jgi:hypothetical protein
MRLRISELFQLQPDGRWGRHNDQEYDALTVAMQVLHDQGSNAEAVMQFMAAVAKDKHVYAKQMGKFVSCIQHKWLKEGVHVVRPPFPKYSPKTKFSCAAHCLCGPAYGLGLMQTV